MRKVLSVAIMLLAVGLTHSQVVTTDRTVGDYKKDLKKITEFSKKVGKLDTYKDFSLRNNKTSEVKKFEEFSEFDKKMICLFHKLKFEDDLKKLQSDWILDYERLSADADKGNNNDPDTTIAKSSHVARSLDGLFEIRKQVAASSEADVEQIFKDFPDNFSEKERDITFKKLKAFHDNERLIKR